MAMGILHNGQVEVVCGSMFSGKTEELMRRLRRAQYAKQKIQVFKPVIDQRYSVDHVQSHDANKILSIPVTSAREILEKVDDNTRVVGIDEAQFFDDDISMVCEQLALKGVRVIVAGLDMDYLGKPYGPMPGLLATANYITKLHAVCVKCGNLAGYSYRFTNQQEQLVLGEKQHYEARCRNCFEL